MNIKQRGIPKPKGVTTALATAPCDPCGNLVGSCQDVFLIPNAEVVTSFEYTPHGGTAVVIPIAASTGYQAVRSAIATAIMEYEQNVFVGAIPGTTDYSFTHDGYGEITLINAIARVSRLCNVAKKCDYKYNYVPNADPTLDVFTNGATNTNLVAVVDAPALVALLQPLAGTGVVSVVYDASNLVYEITISGIAPQTYKMNGNAFLQCNCLDVFVA